MRALVLVTFVTFAALPAHAQIVTQQTDPHHTAVAGGLDKNGNVLGNASELKPGQTNEILIQAPSTYDTSAKMCIALEYSSNDPTSAIFVPWNSQKEWSAFQAATQGSLAGKVKMIPAYTGALQTTQCCSPITIGTLLNSSTICNQSISSSVLNEQVGSKVLGMYAARGTQAQDQASWAAPGDFFSAVASQLLGVSSSSMSYEINYECLGGQWVQMNGSGAEGNCSQGDGVCGAGYGTNGSTPTAGFDSSSVPATSTLCSNSTVDSGVGVTLNGSTNLWQWQCDGTSGNANVACTALNTTAKGCIAGDDASNVTGTLAGPPANLDSLCTTGYTLDRSFTLFYSNYYWWWQCDGPNNTYAECASVNTGPTATCGSGSTQSGSKSTAFTSGNPPTGTQLCSVGTSDASQGAAGVLTYVGGSSWTWYCYDSVTNTQAWCNTYDPGAPTCGSANQQTYSSEPTANLCSNGSTESGIVAKTNPDGWYWECDKTGYTNGTAWCFAYADATTTPSASCGSSNGGSFSSAPTSGLCASGDTASSVTGSGPWSWTCSLNGTSASCSASLLASGGGSGTTAATGVCGLADGGQDWEAPNTNLCSAGTNSTVTWNASSSTWTWVCDGTTTNSGTCTTDYCAQCSGTTTISRSYSRGSGTCAGTVSWTETDSLSSTAGTAGVISWTDAMGTYTQSGEVGSSAPDNFCGPCYATPTAVSGVSTHVTSGSSCASGVTTGSTITPTTTPTVK